MTRLPGQLSLQNITTEPVTVSLRASLCPAGVSDAKLDVTPSEITIPAGSTASSRVVVSASGFKKSGTYFGSVSVEALGNLVARAAVGLVAK